MKLRLLLLTLMCVLAVSAIARPPETDSKGAPKTSAVTDNRAFIDANNIFMFVTNQGSFGRDLSGVFGYDYGTFFPYAGIEEIESGALITSPLYASGLWVGAIDSASGEIRVKVAEYNSEYQVGPWHTPGSFVDDARYRVYKLYRDSLAANPNSDYTNWPVDLGAPTAVDTFVNPADSSDTTFTVVPEMLGDQMLWAIYNDADTTKKNDAGSTLPLGLEIRQTTFAFDREPPLGNIVFLRFQVYNRGGNTLNNCYFSLWSDPDLGGAGDDLVGSDTSLSLGFVYNATNNDRDYGSRPPAFGYDFFQGPLVSTGDMADTGKAWGQLWPGFTNLPMVSFNKYINGTDPGTYNETYNYMQGLNSDGSDPGSPFQVSGDPVKGTGALDNTPADRRMMQSTGPITFRPGDSVEIVAAGIAAQGGDRLTSITVLRFFDAAAQRAYNRDFELPPGPARPNVRTFIEEPGQVVLHWDDRSERNPGAFPFEGYTIWQGESTVGPWTQIGSYDIINGITAIYDTVPNIVQGQLENIVIRVGSDNGINRRFTVTQDYLTGNALYPLTPYYFKVDAYSVDTTQPPGEKVIPTPAVVTVVPQSAPANWDYEFGVGAILPVTHTSGISSGGINPEVVDPRLLNGHEYKIWFNDTVATFLNLETNEEDSVFQSWTLFDVTEQETVLANQLNYTGNNEYPITDGFQLKVTPSAGFLNFTTVANANGPIDPPEGASATFQGFPGPADPGENQQSNGSNWFIHIADDNGLRGPYDQFLDRVSRAGANLPAIGLYDYEIRFTGSLDAPNVEGSWAWNFFVDEEFYWVPFELWQIGVATPDDPSDDVRMIPWMLEEDGNYTFDLENLDHSVSGAANDPFTAWIYWMRPGDSTPGESGYLAAETAMQAGTYTGDNEIETMVRMVLVSWNGGTEPPYDPPMVEQGTIFRIETAKAITTEDTFTFVAAAPIVAETGDENTLDRINVVPNPFYLFGPYDQNPAAKEIKFQHLPAKCTISIYNLSGDLVNKLEKDDATSTISWDGQSANRLPIASGIYIYVVDAPGFGQKIGKMAIFTEVEVLKLY